MNDDLGSQGADGKAGQNPATSETVKPSYDEIALRAYFIALNRHANGEPGDPLKDWIEAEKQLRSTTPR